ncbi:Lysophospholipase, alpha-beta hydrolase superfamily [Amycolatopsis pretoriensis]|uniref:Lysophospholipase, alpha-beta hydrolase superfamily n=1 Tax=Amycolatopsis pretoriensis TaxID=218821 RepID=A0A1H5R1V5_9PSEU|nr:alpha/beta fold hydrolase [Amycolatopsis pretoriensis]SEF32315.1 Lysophospholipase, alpha-beta hydrolase superfamily [Amycolatopsis pretoriensis]
MTSAQPAHRRPPHRGAEPTRRRRGGFFLDGEWDAKLHRPVGSAWVRWEAPADEGDWTAPVVLVHGGGGQSTDWLWAVDGQPGWAELFVGAGHPTYLLDRPGHGRSVWDVEAMGPRSAVPDTTVLARLFQVDEAELRGRFGAVAASSTGLFADAAAAQRRDAAALTRLLELVGPAIVVTHSAGAPAGWLAADRRPDLVDIVVAVEPLGPPRTRALTEGVTALPLGAAGQPRGLATVPVLLVTAAASGHLQADSETAAFLRGRGAEVEHLRLGQHGLDGDGHGVLFDRNSTAAFDLVHRHLPAPARPGGGR